MARESKESIRDKIITAAEGLFWHYGIKKVTVDEIAAAADIGKGTVYLHFESKEEIGIAIITRYKQEVLEKQLTVVNDKSIPVIERLKQVISLPVLYAHERANKSPMVLDLLNAVRPQLGNRLLDMVDREIDVIAIAINDGNLTGEMHVEKPLEAARELKMIALAYMPGSSVCLIVDDPVQSVSRTVEFIYRGLR